MSVIASSIEPWVKPYERQYLADIVMSAERDPVAAAYLMWSQHSGASIWGTASTHDLLLITGLGIVTTIPLLGFAHGAPAAAPTSWGPVGADRARACLR